MRTFFLSLILLPLFCFAQKKSKGYFSVDGSLQFKSKTDPGFGGLISGNLRIKNEFFAGLQIGALSLPNVNGVYVPLQARFTIAPSFYSNRTSIFMLIEPGYGIHNKTYNYSLYAEEGGFTFFAGAGILLPASPKGALSVAVGYSSFGFRMGDEKWSVQMLALRLGVLLR